jgi:1-phosphofructokinase
MTRRNGSRREERSVCVLAPAPVLTITIEEHEEEPEIHVHAGGQGVWLARLVRRLEVPVVLCGLFGGETGRVVEALLAAEGFQIAAFGTELPNGTYVHDRRHGFRTVIAETSTKEADRHDVDDLFGAALVHGIDAGVMVLTGVFPGQAVPHSFYEELAFDLRRNGATVVVDLSGDPLRAALRGGIDVVKISHEELIRDGYATGATATEISAGIRRLQGAGAENVIVSCAERGAIALVDGALVEIQPVALHAIDHHGAGDSMTAGIAAGVARNLDLVEAVRLGAAAGALNVVRHGLGTGQRATIETLVPRIAVGPLT